MKRNLYLLALLALLLAAAGCGNGSESSSPAPAAPVDGPITLTLFDKNVGDPFTNPVSVEITKRTGIFIEIQQPTGNPDEKLSLMLASGDLPDIVLMDRREATLNKYITSGALIPLNDLMREHAPNILEQYEDILAKSVFEDGKNYYFNNWYGLDPDPNWSVGIRMDLLEEFGYGSRAQAGDAFTQDEFVDVLRKFKDKYPGGSANPALPLTADASYMPSLIGTFKSMYGMKNYYEHDGRIEFDVRDPRYLEMLKFINGLLNDGLLDPEWGINNGQMCTEKEVAGRVAAHLGSVGDANSTFLEDYGEDTNRLFYSFIITAPGVSREETTYGPRSSLGWDGIGITAVNKYPVETIKFLDFLASEEGQYLLMWGVEGQNWTLVDGIHTPTQEALESRNKDWAAFSLETGARKWTWMIKNGYGADGTPHDFMFRYERNKVDTHALTSMAGTVWDTALYDDIGPTAGTPEALSEQKVRDIIDAGFASIVNAKPEDVERLYGAMIADMDATNNAKTVEDIFTQRYAAKVALYNQATGSYGAGGN
ncbi:MAG: extracellular solute-binding protein [Clostridiales bacterium]|jgi:putative aldouronate transport system substrate-binding protein|nr:extracellular solute-binding protein [Clostridiales bacterium]